jgi:hypothetical protein
MIDVCIIRVPAGLVSVGQLGVHVCVPAETDSHSCAMAMALVTSMSFGLSAAGYLGHRRAAQFARDIELYLC